MRRVTLGVLCAAPLTFLVVRRLLNKRPRVTIEVSLVGKLDALVCPACRAPIDRDGGTCPNCRATIKIKSQTAKDGSIPSEERVESRLKAGAMLLSSLVPGSEMPEFRGVSAIWLGYFVAPDGEILSVTARR